MNKKKISRLALISAPIALCFLWLFATTWLGLRVFIKEGAPDAMIVVTVAAFIGLFCAWRHALRGEQVLFSGSTLFKTFFWTFTITIIALWNAPEAWVNLTAREIVSSKVSFHVGHPGPSTGKNTHCSAGLRFYDAWLKRSVELCTRDEHIPSAARTLEIEKRITTHGARFIRYRFISVDGTPHRWIDV